MDAGVLVQGYFERPALSTERSTHRELYILVTGAVELIMQRNGIELVIGEANKGDVGSKIGVPCHRPQLFTVRTKRLSQLLRLNSTSFLNIVQTKVGDGTIIMNNLLQHLKEWRQPLMKVIHKETEYLLARGRMKVPLSLCIAATSNNDQLLSQLLRHGPDLNATDNKGRTAMACTFMPGKIIHEMPSNADFLSLYTRSRTKFGHEVSCVLTKEGAEVEDIKDIRDGDHLILASGNSNAPLSDEHTTADK